MIAERPYGTFARQVFLGSNLNTEHIKAEYEAGVLTLVLPVAEHASLAGSKSPSAPIGSSCRLINTLSASAPGAV